MRTIALFMLFLSALPVFAQAPSEEQLNHIMNNVSHEYTICAAYFSLVSGVLGNAGDSDDAATYAWMTDEALILATTFGRAGRDRDMLSKIIQVRLDTAVKGMRKEINNDAANFDLLLAKHGERCKWSLENTDALIEEWTTKELSRQ